MSDSLAALANFISRGRGSDDSAARPLLEALFGERYHKRHHAKGGTGIRDALRLGTPDEGEEGVPYAGLINPDNPPSGPYGGTSVVWFPTREHGSLLGLGVGTRGLSPDEGILTRPGHRRRAEALRRYLAGMGVEAWSKPDPANLSVSVPQTAAGRFPGFEKALKRYGHEMYCMALVPGPDGPPLARQVVQAFFDWYAYERGWEMMTAYRDERDELLATLRRDLFAPVTDAQVYDLLKARHFVILQGPPGTGKTRLAEQVREQHFSGKGMTIQFHPAITYEDFVVGLSPDINKEESLRFEVRPGWLHQACAKASADPYLLIIDEINRADLGKILGEGIYLFEPDEVGKRTVELAHPVQGETSFSLPANLYVLGTMNTADRSIASIDLAIRRRFSFINMMPDRDVIANQGIALATQFYDRLCDAFLEYAPSDALDLLPGHSYFLAKDEDELKKRLRYELIPLLNEYLREGYLGPATTELQAVRDAIEDEVR
ncbi:MAG: AAA family ATPase [Deltaproteobacteria bacterium]|nr:AAA family ATPase [Deltaproteobacteria bacterium]